LPVSACVSIIMRQKTQDPRWSALETVQAAMEPLGLRDRDLAVLRGLLSFVPAGSWEGAMMVFASNRVLQERCGGMDERTLRRRLAQLCQVGLIRRQQSPNRKRYMVRDETGAPVLTYGFDLTPLRAALPRIAAMAEEVARLALRLRALRAVLRDRLYHLTVAGVASEACAAAARLLRRKVEPEVLVQAIDDLQTEAPMANTEEMTASVGQNDRDIQSSTIDHNDKKTAVSLGDCLDRAPNAMSFASCPPKAWEDAHKLAITLAPAIGIDGALQQRAQAMLGTVGATLAILGLVESHGRIRDPARYLHALTQKATKGLLNIGHMFRSLTQTARFPAGNALA